MISPRCSRHVKAVVLCSASTSVTSADCLTTKTRDSFTAINVVYAGKAGFIIYTSNVDVATLAGNDEIMNHLK